MKTRNLVSGAAAAAMMIWTAGCMSDNSVGGGTGGSAAPGSGGAPTSVGTGGTSAPGTGGGSVAEGTGGSGTGGTAPSGSGGAVGTGGRAAAGTGGATGPSGGSTGTGTAGAGGPSLCPVAGTTICDGFEAAAPGAAGSDWTATGTITVDATKAYRGTKSVKFVGALAYILEKKTFAGTTKMANNNLWVRYFFLSNQASVAAAAAGHVWFAALNSLAGGGDDFHPLGGSRGKLQAEIAINGDKYTDNRMPAAGTTSPNYPILADGWQCWEFHVQSDDSYDFFMNGKEVLDMKIVAGKASKSGVSFSPMPTFSGLQLGWQDFNGTTLTGWIDEVAVGPNQIGCGN